MRAETKHGPIHAGRLDTYADTVLYSTMMPCYMCAGAVVQFGIKRVVAGEAESVNSAREFMEAHGVEVIDLDLDEPKQLLREFMEKEAKAVHEDGDETDR